MSMKNSIIVVYTLLFCLYTQAQAQVDEPAPDEIAAIVSELVGDMVSIPAGSFCMGDLDSDWDVCEKPLNHVMDGSLRFVSQITSIPDVEVPLRRVTFIRRIQEDPVHRVTIPAFRLGKYEVTVGQFRAFVVATGYLTYAERNAGREEGCSIWDFDEFASVSSRIWYNPDDPPVIFTSVPGSSWRNPGYAVAEDQPVVCVSWEDAQAFIGWLNGKTGGNYRLPSEAEWEYAARAGSTTKYSWGADIGINMANCRNDDCGDRWEYTAPVGSFPANAWGLHDMHGNVEEWVEDCLNYSYEGAPTDGSAWIRGDCSSRMVRGGAWFGDPRYLRSASRYGYARTYRDGLLGFRLAQDQ